MATWKVGCSTFQQHEAKAYCESMGMEPVSLDSPAKQDNFNRLIAQDAQRYFWTGERASNHSNSVLRFPLKYWAVALALGKPWATSVSGKTLQLTLPQSILSAHTDTSSCLMIVS